MNHQPTLNTDKLGKLLALASSDTDAEALAALRKARALLSGAGLDFKHVAERMTADGNAAFDATVARAQKPRDFNNTWKPKPEHAAFWTEVRENLERERRERAAERAKALEKYGSEERAASRNAMEQALHDAARPWLAEPFMEPEEPYLVGRWHLRMGNYDLMSCLDDAPPECRAALEAAIPMPTTVRQARDEYQAWEDRDREIQNVVECWEHSMLDLPAQWRQERVRLLYERDMPITTLDDLHVRLDYAVKADFHPEHETFLSILDGFERLIVNGAVGAADRRASVLAMLSNADTAGWSDRAIARACGVSPTTVGTIRRRTAL
jgi:hypothetical protein